MSHPTTNDAADRYRLEDQIGFQLRRAHQRATEHFNAIMTAFDITPTQFAVLAKLYDLREASQNRLGRLTAMDPATVFGVVARLKKRGFITQRLDPNDGRRVLLSLSPVGTIATTEMRQVAEKVSQTTLGDLSDDEAAQLLHLLDRIAR